MLRQCGMFNHGRGARWGVDVLDWALDFLLRRLAKTGDLTVITASGAVLKYGDGSGTPVTVEFTSRRWQLWTVLDPELKLGEAYVEGTLLVTKGAIGDFLNIVFKNLQGRRQTAWTRSIKKMRSATRTAFSINNRQRSKCNAHHHYDLPYEVFRLFLDPELQYSCAYFDEASSSLDEAQRAKMEHIARKLLLNDPLLRVLDIGCGWGKLDLYLAAEYGAKVVGTNISQEQINIARLELRRAQLASNGKLDCEFRLEDYRSLSNDEKFDRIVSVGMFEHVGRQYYKTFFRKCGDLLADDGVMLLHTVGRSTEPREPNAWVWKYIFPGGYAPSLQELTTAIAQSEFRATDIESLNPHYERTLQEWRRRFLSHRSEIIDLMAPGGERFIRMWEFYLAGFEAGFRFGGLDIFQIQLVKRKAVDSVPLTRKYMYEKTLQPSSRLSKAS
jgi:cyclopropane-fatty-acyl-phospholipid synthase